jgi:hypothetical protein
MERVITLSWVLLTVTLFLAVVLALVITVNSIV